MTGNFRTNSFKHPAKYITGLLAGLLLSAALAFSTSAGSFEVDFIDVGQADSALITCDGESMMIDGGNAEDSQLVYTYLKNRGISHLKYMIGTHTDEDHIGGLAGALNYATVDTAFCSVTEHDTKAFSSFVKYLNKQGKSITVPKAGETFTLGSATVQILGPVHSSEDTNNSSIVARIVYGNTSFLFMGDAETEEEADILYSDCVLKSDVLKVGHHGSDTSTSQTFLNEVSPKYAVISVGEGNSYGHPKQTTLDRLQNSGAAIYRTDINGDIVCTSDGTNLTFTVEKNTTAAVQNETMAAAASQEASASGTYVLNTTNSKKFHYPDCASVSKMKEKNKKIFTGTREEAIAEGYSPCGNCRP